MYKFISLPLEDSLPKKQTGAPCAEYKTKDGVYRIPLSENEHRWLTSMLLGKIITKERVNSKVKFVLDGEFVKLSFVTRFMDDMIIEGDSLRIRKPSKFNIAFE